VRGAGSGPNATDGVVTYQSASIGGVESELVIPFAGHSVQGHPLAIEEVRRILLEHAAAVCAASGIACGPDAGSDDRERAPGSTGRADAPAAPTSAERLRDRSRDLLGSLPRIRASGSQDKLSCSLDSHM